MIYTVYHETSSRFRKFDLKKSTQGIIWFTSDLAGIRRGESGASGHGVILKLRVKMNSPAGWKEYDSLLLDQLRQKHDGAILPKGNGHFDGFVFDPRQIEIVGVVKDKQRKASMEAIQYKGAVYIEAAQRNPHQRMTTQQKTKLRQTLKNRRPTKKVLQSFSAPVWRAITGKTHKGCWESTFTYKIMGGASSGKATNFTRCVGFDKTKKPQIKKDPSKSSGYSVVKQTVK